MTFLIDANYAERVSQLPLEEHQVDAVEFLFKRGRAIIADKMGLGKSLSVLTAAYKRGLLQRRVLIMCSKSALSVWTKEHDEDWGKGQIQRWFPELADRIVLVTGSPAKRAKLWQAANDDGKIYIVTYDTLKQDKNMVPEYWDLIMADEAHKIRNHKNVRSKVARSFKSKDLFIITGTPANKGPMDMWTYLNWLFPKRFPSYWAFVNKYHVVEDGQFGKEIIGVQNMTELKHILSDIMIRRVKASNMPSKRRLTLAVEMSAEEAKIYQTIEMDKIYNKSDGTYVLAATSMTAQLRCRQLFICPKLIDPQLSVGTGLEAIMDHIEDNELTHAVIFTPFPKAFDYLAPAIEDRLKITPLRLRGGMSPEETGRVTDAFRESKKGVVLCSIKFSTSFSLVRASTAYMLGFEWNPEDNYQAEDRLHRMGIKEDVSIYYVMHNSVLAKHQLAIVSAKVNATREVY